MAVNLFGESGLSFGLSEETGILAQSYSKAVSGDEQLAKNHEGEVVGVSEYNPVAEHSVEGHVTSDTGVAAATFGATLTLANSSMIDGGVDAGTIIVTGVTANGGNEDYQSISVEAKQWPNVTE